VERSTTINRHRFLIGLCVSPTHLVSIQILNFNRIAVLADGPKTFTPLALVQPPSGPNTYSGFIHSVYQDRRKFGLAALDEDADKDPKLEQWYQQVTTATTLWLQDVKTRACWTAVPHLGNFDIFQTICFPEEEDCEHVPVKPKSRFRSLLSQGRMSRLRTMMPKWFRDSSIKSSPERDFIAATLELLQEIKAIALKDHNITITSAALSAPKWITNGLGDLFLEACLLADIETFEQPRSRVDMTSRVIDDGSMNEELTVGAWHLLS
jgi:hypothetical protein